MAQNYKNHIRFNPLHHFIITPVSVVAIILAFINYFRSDSNDGNVGLILVLITILLFLIALIARLYSLKLQDRMIRLEMRQRYFELTGESFFPKEKSLTLSQIIALRFADNEELLSLIERAIKEGLKNKEIKKEIVNWQADNLRV